MTTVSSRIRGAFLCGMIAALLNGAAPVPVWAQGSEAPPVSGRPVRPAFYLLGDSVRRMNYDPAENGPLLAVALPNQFSRREPRSLKAVTDDFDRRLVVAGGITVLAPRTMMIITAEPGRAKIFANLEPGERMNLLMASFSEAQWEKAGGAGIGFGDLTPDQQEIFATFIPPNLALQERKITPIPDKTNAFRYESVGEPQPADPRQLRLVIGRRAFYDFHQVGKEDSHAMSNSSRDQGANNFSPIIRLDSGEMTQTDSLSGPGGEKDRRNAFGVPLLRVVPATLKPSDLDYSAPALNVPVNYAEWKTLDEAMTAARQATGLELYADRRVRSLPLILRAGANPSFRAGDLLMALAAAVTGTYRQVGNAAFVLTDDRDGIGTRFARLSHWRDAADEEKSEKMQKALEQMAQNHPLPHLKFLPGDPFALPADLNRKLEDEWKKDKYAMSVEVKTDSLPPALRQDVEKWVKYWTEEANPPLSVRTDKVGIGAQPVFSWRLPDGKMIEDFAASNGYDTGNGFLGFLTPPAAKTAPPEPPPAAPTKKKPPPALPTNLKRRALIINPGTPDEARLLIQAGRARGVREIWVMKTLEAGDDAPLKAALAAAKISKTPVYLAVSLLRFAKIGTPERNILGQDGVEFVKAQSKSVYYEKHPEAWGGSLWQFERYQQWFLPSAADIAIMEKRLLELAALPGVAGIAFKNTAAPGYAGKFDGGDGVWSNGYFGYNLPMRLAFLREKGVDPVDIVEEMPGLNLDYSLPFFPNSGGGYSVDASGKLVERESPEREWRDYRAARSAAWLKRFHNALQSARPNLPLYISDRASDYATPHTEWFGLWENADAIPQNPLFFPEGTGRQLAHQLHKIVLKRAGWDRVGGNKAEPEWFADSIVAKAKDAAQYYDGLAIDVSQLSTKDALLLLRGLAEIAPVKLSER